MIPTNDFEGDDVRHENDSSAGDFPSTHASVIWKAGHPEDKDHRSAQEAFFRQYFKPVRGRFRKAGLQPADADEVVQAYFTHIIEKNLLSQWDPSKGKMRHWLIRGGKNFLIDWWRANRARPDFDAGSLDDDASGVALKDILPHPEALEQYDELDREWYWELFKASIENVSKHEKDPVYVYLLWQRVIYFSPPPSYESLLEVVEAKFGASSELTVGALATAVSRLRDKIQFEIYEQALREEMPNTAPEGLVEEILRSLQRKLPTPEELRDWPAWVAQHPSAGEVEEGGASSEQRSV